jgi:hypothetical protein
MPNDLPKKFKTKYFAQNQVLVPAPAGAGTKTNNKKVQYLGMFTVKTRTLENPSPYSWEVIRLCRMTSFY